LYAPELPRGWREARRSGAFEAIGRRKIKTKAVTRRLRLDHQQPRLVSAGKWYLRPVDLTCSAYSGPVGFFCAESSAWLERLSPAANPSGMADSERRASVDVTPPAIYSGPSITVSLKARESILDRISHHDHRPTAWSGCRPSPMKAGPSFADH